jgi:NAD+ kinase
MIKKIALFGQTYYDDTRIYVSELIDLVQNNKIHLSVETNYKNQLVEQGLIPDSIPSFSHNKNLDRDTDVLITMGGDGTILRAITYVGDSNIPILGINTGRLGFLATVQKSEIDKAFSALLKGEYNSVNRTLLSVQSSPEIEELKEINFALNEISVARLNTASMIGIETHLNNIYLTNYWADGLIVSTPTGSTGYSLSCGGPVIDRKSNSLVLTPIAPHNLNARPLVISNSTEITMKVEGRQEEFLLSLDSRILNLKAGTTISISKADFAISIIELQDQTFYETLRSKLLWGEDTRNRK